MVIRPSSYSSISILDPQPTARFNAKGAIVECNPALSRIAGGESPAALLALMPANTTALVTAALRQQRAIEGVQSRTETQVFEWTFFPDADAEHVIARARETSRETTLLDEATRGRRLYRLIIENTTDLISRHTPEGHFIDASPASTRLLGYHPDELREQPAGPLMDFDSASLSRGELSHQLMETGYATFTIRLRCKNGEKRWVEIASRAIRETYTGEIIEVISVTRDITERKLREAEQRRHQEQLAQTTRLATLGEMASGIAHEMNQPLASITNYANASKRYLQRLPADNIAHGRIAEGLEEIGNHANHAAQVIKRLRAFLRKSPQSTGSASLHHIISKAIALVEWEAERAEITIEYTSKVGALAVRGDAVLLQQVLINLLRNAMEANQEQHPDSPSRIHVTTALVGDAMVEIAVADQGPGVDEEGIEQMFAPFYTRKEEGVGLGLSMSRSIIEGFGGYLDAGFGTGGGLRLSCRLPRTENTSDEQETQR